VQKTKSLKKIKETDAIPSTRLRTGFDNLDAVNRASDNCEDSLRISIDTKAKVVLCDSSRGTSRCKKAVQADDHDMYVKPKYPWVFWRWWRVCSPLSLVSHLKPVILLLMALSTGGWTIEQQASGMGLADMLNDLLTACDVGIKKNSKGYKVSWIWY
jgi:hypothetical protein